MLVPCTLVLLAGGWVTAHNQEDVRNKVDLSDIYGEYGPSTLYKRYVHTDSPVPKGQAFRRTVAPLVHVSDEDIMKFTDDLLDMDQHNCGRYITLQNDPKKKLIQVHKDKGENILKKSTVRAMIKLYNFTNKNSMMVEPEYRSRNIYEFNFLRLVGKTPIFKHLLTFLNEKKIFTLGSKDLEHKLKQIWFTVYRRNSDAEGPNSSGFEHTFVAEYSIPRREVFGFHNWLYFAHEEEGGALDHFGVEKMVDLKGRGYVVKTNIQWKNMTKTGVSMFVGTSPELELAIYTVCFFCRPDKLCKIRLNGQELDIQTYHHNWYDKTLVASAFPIL
uniref:Poly(U)-specific endoribonuclease homolog n=1 Tax=Cacopsylla melanoneura TaxID=428564 RepID=A0A8D8U4V1_9HEMI